MQLVIFYDTMIGMEKMKKIIDRVGGSAALAQALGVTPGAIRERVFCGSFPAAWYFVIFEMLGEVPPRELFSFRVMNDTGKKASGSRKARGGTEKPPGARASSGAVKRGKLSAGAAARRKVGDTEGDT